MTTRKTILTVVGSLVILAIGVGAVLARSSSPTANVVLVNPPAATGEAAKAVEAAETTPDTSAPAAAAAEGQRAPALQGSDPIHGGTFALASTVGRPTVVLVWASWCPECNAEAPTVAALAKAHPEVAFVGVDLRDDTAGAKAFYQRHGWTFPSIVDPDGSKTAIVSMSLGARCAM